MKTRWVNRDRCFVFLGLKSKKGGKFSSGTTVWTERSEDLWSDVELFVRAGAGVKPSFGSHRRATLDLPAPGALRPPHDRR